jgi:two-component system, OmpR family, sensor histidine kinase MprB
VNFGLRGKLMLLLAVISAATALSVGFVSYGSMQQRLRTEIDRSLVEATNRFLDGPNGVRRFRLGGRLSVVIPERPLGIEQYVVQVASGDGEVVAATPGVTLPVVAVDDDAWRRALADGAIVRTVTSAEGDRYRVRTVALALPGNRELVLQLGRDFSETDNVLSDLRTRILVIGALVVVIAAFVGGAISTGVTSRLRRLSHSVEHIADTGELAVELSVEGRDETSRLARSFQDMVKALHESRSQQRRLVQDAGHELRTPLTSLRTNIDVLRRHPDLSDAVRSQILTDLDQDITELRDLVEEIVTLAAQVDPSAIESEPIETVVLGDLVAGVVERVRRRTGRNIIVDVDDSMVSVRPMAIERAVSNLLDNAVKFDSTGGLIEVSVDSGRVTVRDRGPGIPDSDLEAVFARFHRSPQARSQPGSGLGLAIVADAVLAHDGGHFAHRREGGGAEVGFWIPLATR